MERSVVGNWRNGSVENDFYHLLRFIHSDFWTSDITLLMTKNFGGSKKQQYYDRLQKTTLENVSKQAPDQRDHPTPPPRTYQQ